MTAPVASGWSGCRVGLAPTGKRRLVTAHVESRCGAVAVGRTYLFAAPFVWRCLSGSTMAPFPHPAHRTGRADFPHPALGQDLTPPFACNAICSFWTLFGVDRLPNLQVPHHVVRLS